LHESGEILLGDIPAPAAAFFGPAGKSKAERDAGKQVLAKHTETAKLIDEFAEGKSLEARLARTLDKLQMMIQVLIYESEGKGRLDEFWEWEGNFPLCGIQLVDDLFLHLKDLRGKICLDYRGMLAE
jgi:5'-deoxynucleotidase YfbR-like HD superfamily hydrolase